MVINLFSRKIGGIQDIFYYYGITLVLTNMFWELWDDPLIFPINENNISAWTLQWKPLVNSEWIENFQSDDCSYYFFWNTYVRHFYLRFKALLLSIQAGSLSSNVIISCEMKLCDIFLTVLLNKWIMSVTFIFCNDFFHWKPLIAFLIWSTWKYGLIIKIDNMGWFMNQFFQSELRRNTINSIAFISCFTSKEYHAFVFALKSPRTTIKYGFHRVIDSRLVQSLLCLISKVCTHINWINIMTIRTKRVIRTDKQIIFIFVWKLSNSAELSARNVIAKCLGEINVIEHKKGYYEKNLKFRLKR